MRFATRETNSYFADFSWHMEIPRVVGVVGINVILELLGVGHEGGFYDGVCFCGEVPVADLVENYRATLRTTADISTSAAKYSPNRRAKSSSGRSFAPTSSGRQ